RHRFGIGARTVRGDPDGRKIDRRHAGDGEEAVSHPTHQKEPDGKERGPDRPPDEWLGEIRRAHAVTPPGAVTARARPASRAQARAPPDGSAASSPAPSRDRRPASYRASATGSAAVRR